jgi:hypothetical protein
MLLSLNNEDFIIPHTSSCIIRTKGVINDGDTISVESVIFASTRYLSRAVDIGDTFDVTARVLTDETITSDGNMSATLVCDDNDVFNMYVRIL